MNRVGPRALRILPALLLLVMGAHMATAQSNAPLNVMPLPTKSEGGEGSLKMDASFRIAFTGYREPRLERHNMFSPGFLCASRFKSRSILSATWSQWG